MSLKGKKVILAFYPADWSLMCGSQMNLYLNDTIKSVTGFTAPYFIQQEMLRETSIKENWHDTN